MLSHFKRKAVRTLVSLYLLFSNVGDVCTVVEPFQLQLFKMCFWQIVCGEHWRPSFRSTQNGWDKSVWTVDTVKQSTSWRSRIMFYTTLYVSNTSAIPTCTNLRAVIAQPQQIRSCRRRSVLNTIVPVHSTASYMWRPDLTSEKLQGILV